MARLIEALCSRADFVLFDSPPVLAVTDATILSRQVDGALIIVEAGQTKEEALAQAAAELQKTGANLLGVLLNRLSVHSGNSYYYQYDCHTDANCGQSATANDSRPASGEALRHRLRQLWPGKERA